MTEHSQRDRRVRRTRRALQKALISLILEKGFDSVTIEEITDRADLGRTTFYLHFKDKEDLLMQAIDSISEDFIEQHGILLNKVKDPQSVLSQIQLNLDESIIYNIFAHARDNADLYKVVLRGEGSARASARFLNIIKNEAIRRMKDIEELESKVPVEVFSVFFSGTLMALVTWWLEEDQPYAIKDMVQYYQQLLMFGALDTLHLEVDRSQ
jgi:AcrR family transcriptional regulator